MDIPGLGSFSNIAEKFAEGITGSELVGDLVGLGAAVLTGDVGGVVSQAFDLGENAVAGAKTFGVGFQKAMQAGFEALNNPGSVKEPSQAKKPESGYAPEKPKAGQGPGQTEDKNPIENPPSDLDQEIDAILDGPGDMMTKIFKILMKLQKEKRKEAEEAFGKLKGASKEDRSVALQEFQKAQGELQELTSMASNIMKIGHEMYTGIIQNIRA